MIFSFLNVWDDSLTFLFSLFLSQKATKKLKETAFSFQLYQQLMNFYVKSSQRLGCVSGVF